MKRYKKKILTWFSTYELNGKHALAFLVFSLFLFFSPLLFFGKILLNGDATYYAYPVAYFFSNFFGSPINPFTFSGYPVADAFQIGYFHPLYNIFFKFFDYLFAYHFLLFLDFALAGVFTYLFSRKIGLSTYAGLLASFAYTFAQFSIAWLGVISVANAVFLLPVMMYCILQIADLKKRFIFIFGLIVGIAFLGTHYQFIVISLLGGGIFLLFEIWQRWKAEKGFFSNLKPLFFLCTGAFLALLISLPQALHSLTFFGQSTREAILVYHGAPFIDLARYLIPTFDFPYISMLEFRPYIGIAPLFFAFLSMYAIYRKKITDKRALFFLWFFAITFVMSLELSPLLFVVKFLPFIKYFAEQARWMYLANFALVILSAYGLDFVLKNREVIVTEKVKRFFKNFSITVTVFFVSANLALLFLGQKLITFTQNYFDSYLYAKTTHLPIQYYHDIIEIMAKKAFLNVSFLNPNIILFIVFSALLYWLLKITERKTLFSNLMVLFVFFNMITVSLLTFNFADRSLISGTSHIADFIHSRQKSDYDYRAFGFLVPFVQYQKITAIHPEAEEESLIFAKESLMGNLNIFSEVPIVGGYDPMAFRRYQDLVTHLENTTAQKTIDEKISLFLSQLNLLSALNVKYVVSPYVLESSDLTLIFSEKVTNFNVPLYLYENKKVLPRFYLAKSVTFLREFDESGSFTKVIEARSDFSEVTFIECDKCMVTKTVGVSGTATLISESDKNIEMEVKSNSDQFLILSNQAVPGWQVTLDGNPVQIYYANHAYMAVSVPKGNHKVVFSYNPWKF